MIRCVVLYNQKEKGDKKNETCKPLEVHNHGEHLRSPNRLAPPVRRMGIGGNHPEGRLKAFFFLSPKDCEKFNNPIQPTLAHPTLRAPELVETNQKKKHKVRLI